MSELLLVITVFIVENPELITWGGVVLLILLSLFLRRNKIKESFAEWKLKSLLRNVGVESIHNVIIPDGMDGNIFIEHLVLMPNEIFLLGEKKYRGLIFAAEKIDLWTQVVGNKSYKFENPLHQLDTNIVSLNSIVKNSKVGKKVLFIKGSEFPKGKPENIVSVDELKEWQRKNIIERVAHPIQDDWSALLAVAEKNNLELEPAVLTADNNKSKSNVFSFLGLITVIGLWLAWRLYFSSQL